MGKVGTEWIKCWTKERYTFHLKRIPTAHELLHAQNQKTSGCFEFLKSYSVVEADAVIEIGTA